MLFREKGRQLVVACVLFILLFIDSSKAEAVFVLNESFVQVKEENNDTVFYLDHSGKIKKSYINKLSYLIYGNKWTDVKIVPDGFLDNWQEAELLKIDNSRAVYQIYNGKRALIANEQVFYKNGFNWRDVLTVHELDLIQYDLVSYDELQG